MSKKQRKPQTLKELQAEWYAKAADSGFNDIEDVSHPDRPLKEWHSRKFLSDRSRLRQMERDKYNQQIDEFINAGKIDEICSLIVKHGNSSIGPKKVKRIIEFHRNGLPERTIAKKVRCGKKCVHLTLKKAREWMKVA